ncbi:MAG: substrate-binding domain-containing protein [Eggerthellaceae bacterium]|jgi:putative molybdopterin biosynthesis protein
MPRRSDFYGHALDAREVAVLLGVSQNLVYKLAKEGEIPSYHVGRKLRFASDDIAEYRGHGRHKAKHVAESDGEYISQLLEPARRGTFRIMGMGRAVHVLSEYLEEFGMRAACDYRSGYASLIALYMNQADAAIVNLWDHATDSCNLPYVRRLAPGMPCIVLTLGAQSYGFVVKRGNPKGVRDWIDLLGEGIVLANQDPGSSARILLDEHLVALEAVPERILGYSRPLHSELSVGSFVARDEGDVGVATEQLFHEVDGLDYLPMQEVNQAFVIRKTQETKDVIPLLKQLVQSDHFKQRLVAPGFRPDTSGHVIYEV